MKRVLKKNVQTTIEAITLASLMTLCMINDFELSAWPIYLLIAAVPMTGMAVLKKWGRDYE